VSEQHKQILYFAFLTDDVMKCVQEIIFSTVQHDDHLDINFVVAPPPSASVFHLSILSPNIAIYEKSSFVLKFMSIPITVYNYPSSFKEPWFLFVHGCASVNPFTFGIVALLPVDVEARLHGQRNPI
jgi:hypothetical protein